MKRQPGEDNGPDRLGAVSFMDLESVRLVNLSHSISPTSPLWPGDPRVEFTEWSRIEDEGFFLRRFAMSEHGGTHLTAPASFFPGGITVEDIPVERLVAPVVVVDVRAQCLHNPDYGLTLQDIAQWESRNGPVPSGCLVLLLTGWSEHWGKSKKYLGKDSDGTLHFPGFGLQAAGILIEDRGAAGLATDSGGIEPGVDRDFSVSRLVLGRQGIVIQNLTNLDQLAPTGSILVIGHLKLVGGSGSPAAVTAFVPVEKYQGRHHMRP